jgi:Uma2 family endonuclease
MPVAVEAPKDLVTPPHKLWTREECAVLERSGIVDLDRYELVEGELIQKMPKGHAHMLAVMLLASWLRKVYGEFLVVTEPTIDVRPEDNPTSLPEPDVIVLTRSIRELTDRARPQELRLVGEVSNTTLAFDLTTKARLYARSRIPEYWVLDVEARRLLVHREPTERGYASIQAYGEDEQISTLGQTSDEVRVGDLLK